MSGETGGTGAETRTRTGGETATRTSADAATDTGNTTPTDRTTAVEHRISDLREHVHALGRAVFGDRVGLVVWLGLALALATLWRVGIFLTDTYTVANTLVNLAEGRLAVTDIEYSLAMGAQPGLHQYEGVLYGRNYGQAALAVPLLWTLSAAATVAEPRFVLLGAWALGIVAFARHLGPVLERRGGVELAGSSIPVIGGRSLAPAAGTVAMAGSAIAILVVAHGVLVGTPLDPDMLGLAALQASTVLAAATLGLAAYRLLSLLEGRRVGVAAGVAAGLATPIGFWASIPKRHVLVAALLMAAIYCFARSRQTDDVRLRAGAYVFAGLIAWVHAFEGFFLVVVLGAVDLATASSNGRRQLAIVALALLIALAPTFATNAAITGNPLKAPRLLPGVGVGGVELAPGGDARAVDASAGIRTSGGGGDLLGNEGQNAGGQAGAGDGGTGAGAGDGSGAGGDGSGATGPLQWIVGLVGGFATALIGLIPRPPDTVLVIASFVLTTVTDGLAVLSQPERLLNVFVRGGRVASVDYAINEFEVIDLTVLESMPLLGALVALPVAAAGKLRAGGRSLLRWPRSASPGAQTDLLVALAATVFTVVYLSRLPLQSMLTMRYLMPLFPLGLYGVARLGPVSGAVSAAPGTLARAYGATVVVGGALAVVALGTIEPALGEAVQFHALVNLAAAVLLAVAVVARALATNYVGARWVAGTLAVAAGATTTYLALAALAYFPYGTYALDAAGVVADALSTLV